MYVCVCVFIQNMTCSYIYRKLQTEWINHHRHYQSVVFMYIIFSVETICFQTRKQKKKKISCIRIRNHVNLKISISRWVPGMRRSQK